MEEKVCDMISNIPLDVLELIVSLLPLKNAVRTSSLSTAWNSRWKPLHIHFEVDSKQRISCEMVESMKQIVASFLKNHDAPRQLKISLGQPGGVEEEMMIMATKGMDQVLHLDFSKGKKVSSGRGSLTFESCCTPTCHIHPLEMTGFFLLKTLHLRSIASNYLIENFVSALFSSCCFLQNLKLEKCSCLEDINIRTSSVLQEIELSDCPDLASITISAPNLKRFYYKGVLPTRIQLEDTPLLFHVKFDVRDGLGPNQFDYEDVLSFLSSLKDIENLTISGWLIEWLCAAGVIFGSLDFQFNKLKKLCWMHSQMDKPKHNSLACFLNITPILEILSINVGESCLAMPSPFFHRCCHEPHLWMDYEMVKTNAAQLKYLKEVKIIGYSSNEHEFLLMDLLLHMALNLKLLTVTTSLENRSWKVTKMPQSQIVKRREFLSTRTVVSSSNTESVFVFKEEYGVMTQLWSQLID